MDAGPDRFADAAFVHGDRIDHSSTLQRRDYLERALFDSYLSTLVERDGPGDLVRRAGIPRTTLVRYLGPLRAVDTAKLAFVDTGLASHLIGQDEHRLAEPGGAAVDAVLEAADGQLIGVEVKAGATVRAEDLAGLRQLARRAGERFVAGYVLYTGRHTLPLGPKLRAVPIDALWQLAP